MSERTLRRVIAGLIGLGILPLFNLAYFIIPFKGESLFIVWYGLSGALLLAAAALLILLNSRQRDAGHVALGGAVGLCAVGMLYLVLVLLDAFSLLLYALILVILTVVLLLAFF